MEIAFYSAGAIALAAAALAVSRLHAVHALLYMVVALLAVAVCFFTLGAPFAAALQVIIYAGAIMVLFVFVIMMLNLGEADTARERQWLRPGTWLGPALLALALLLELVYALALTPEALHADTAVAPAAVGAILFGPYLIGVELAALLLLAGLVAAYHLARRDEGT